MMLTSYFQGQKHFPINYDLKRIIGYIIFAITLYLLSNLFANYSVSLKLLLNTVLLFFFLGTVFKLEKKQFKSVAL
jgi:thiol:disulfide interchange protein